MKPFFLSSALTLLIGTCIQSQTVNVTVHTTKSFEVLPDGSLSGNWFPVVQKTFDPDNRLALERIFDNRLKKQVAYIWYFYDDKGRLASREHFSIDRLPIHLRRITYNETGDTAQVLEYVPSRDTIALDSQKDFFYSPSRLLVQTKIYNADHSLTEVCRYAYRKGAKQPYAITVKNSSVPYKSGTAIAYNDSTLLPRILQKKVKSPKPADSYSLRVEFNAKGRPLLEEYRYADQNSKKRSYIYSSDVILKEYRDEDGSGKLTGQYVIEIFFVQANLDARSYFETAPLH
jgi:hypothetical protein